MTLKALAILPVSIGGRLTTSSIIDGLKQNNINVTVFDELYDELSEEIISSNYDFLVGYDFSPLEFKLKHSLDSKCLCYFSDDIQSKTSGPNWESLYKELNRDDVFTFFWDRKAISKHNFKNIYYLPHFVNFELYTPNHNDEFDVMFAGRLDTDFRLNFFIKLMKNLPNLKFAWYAIERHYQDALCRTNEKELINKAYQGFIDNEFDMAVAINKSKVLFNMNSQGISSLNYRTFQTIACKRIMISDIREELDLFKGNLPYWETLDDLVNKIQFFNNSPDIYARTTETCWQIGKANHHSKENVAFMLKKALITNT